MDPAVVIPEVVGLSVCFLILPSVAIAIADARRQHGVRCPATAEQALVVLDPRRAVRAMFTDTPHRVTGCSEWPARAGCDRACEAFVS